MKVLFPDLIPQELKDNAVWCPSGRGGNKSPYKPSGEKGVDYSDVESSFTTFDEAYKLYQRDGYDGVAMLVVDGLFVVDLDHVSQDGKLTVEAQRIIKSLDTYTEQSQSGDGVHIIGKVPKGYNFDRSKYYENHGEKEAYVGPRPKVVTITGNREPLGSANVELRPVEVMDFLKEFMTKPPVPDPTPVADMIPVDDDFIVDHIRRPGTHSGRLWSGDKRDYNDDWSRADYGLINAILKYSNDANQIERVFRRSGLVRPKDDKKRSGTTYLRSTIESAIKSYSGPRYDPNHKSAPMRWDDTIQYDGRPTTEAEGGESVNDQKTTKEAEEATPATNEKAPAAPTSLKPSDYSDSANADVFLQEYKDKLLRTDSQGWFWWTGTYWRQDDHAALRAAKNLSLRMLAQAEREYKAAADVLADATIKALEDKSQAATDALEKAKGLVRAATAFLTHANKLRSAHDSKAMIEMATPEFTVAADTLDSDPFLLCTPAGVINLKDGTIRAATPEDRCTKITAASPGEAGADAWREILETVTQGNDSMIGYLQVLFGSCIIGRVYEEVLPILYGSGRNGKSSLLNAISKTLGSYAGGISIDVLTTDKQSRGASLAELRGRRFIVTSELEQGHRLSVSTLKRICSTDDLVIEMKFKQPETIKPTHHIIMATNHLPRIGSTDVGTWRRLRTVPFNAVIDPADAIPNYAEKLVEEAGPAILSWLSEGASLFVKNGFRLPDEPDAVAESTDQYRSQEDWLNNFLSECCVTDPHYLIRSSELYAVYRRWAESVGDYVRRQSEFNLALSEAGFMSTRPRNVATWHGLMVSEDAPTEKSAIG